MHKFITVYCKMSLLAGGFPCRFMAIFFMLLIPSTVGLMCAESSDKLQNDLYTLQLDGESALLLQSRGMPIRRIVPEFTVITCDVNPVINRYFNHPNYPIAPRASVRWLAVEESTEEVNRWLASPGMSAAVKWEAKVVGDGIQRIWEYRDKAGQLKLRVGGRSRDGTTRPFSAGKNIPMAAVAVALNNSVFTWRFPEQSDFKLEATIRLPSGMADPVMEFQLTAKKTAFYSVAFTGSPVVPRENLLKLPQECAGAGGVQGDFVMSEADLNLPRVMVAESHGCYALVIDPKEGRYRLPSMEDSRFGLMLRFMPGDAVQPVALSPLLGGSESHMSGGATHAFSFRIVAREGDWKPMHRHIAQDIYNISDQRDSSGSGSLNDCLIRVLDFLSNRNGKNYAMWSDQQKYYDYFTDQTGVFKPFSPLYGLGAAIVTDDEEFYRKRALPAIEFAISRKSNVFAPYEFPSRIQVKSATSEVGGPYIGYSQLGSLRFLLQDRTPAIRAIADSMELSRNDIASALTKWRLSSDRHDLKEAESLAAKMADRSGFIQGSAVFDFLDLFDGTRNALALRGAQETAYQVITGWNHYPSPPSDMLTVDKGGLSPIHLHSFGRHKNGWGFQSPTPVQAPEQIVPAWRISRIGIPSPAYPMEYWMNAHGAVLRTAALCDDQFLRDIARNGMVGRFANYAGDNRTFPSLIGERGDAIESPPWKWSFATVNPGHAWDFAGAVIDYLVADVFDRSRGNIDFPAESAAGSGFRVRVYGARPGVFYGENDARLWLPRDLVKTDCQQLNWLAAYNRTSLFIAFTNQSSETQSAEIAIDQGLVEVSAGESRHWINNVLASPVIISSNRLRVSVPPKGISAYAIPAKVHSRFQAKMLDPEAPKLGRDSFTDIDMPTGKIHAMLLSAGRGLTNAFIYAEMYPKNVISAGLRWRQGDSRWVDTVDSIFPYEFSIPMDDGKGEFQFEYFVEMADGKIERSPVTILRLGNGSPVSDAPQSPAGQITMPGQPLPLPDPPSNFTVASDFLEYVRVATNPTSFGLENGRFFPYSTPVGRRIGPGLVVWDKRFFAEGCLEPELSRRLIAQVYHAEKALGSFLAQRFPHVKFEAISKQQREVLVDFTLSEGVENLNRDLVALIIADDWDKIFQNHQYIRYNGPATDNTRNVAFVRRYQK